MGSSTPRSFLNECLRGSDARTGVSPGRRNGFACLLIAILALSLRIGAQSLPTSISISPATPTITPGQQLQFTVGGGSNLPIQGVRAIASGGFTECALLNNGTVTCWGDDGIGELGDGTSNETGIGVAPVMVSGIDNAIAIASGTSDSCALIAGGTVQCWGVQNDNSTGGPNIVYGLVPVTVSGLTGVVAISVGDSHNCALLSNGTAKCWGDNTYGELGNGTTVSTQTPVTVTGLTGATKISAGYGHSCALLADGTVQCWGSNSNGQLGNGTTTSSTTPVAVTGVTGATDVSAGGYHSCAVHNDGTAQCWGSNADGQLGNGTTTDSATPVIVSGLTEATSISTGDVDTCALRSNGTAQCWGYNNDGQLGNGTLLPDGGYANSSVPIDVDSLSGATGISASENDTCAVLSNGTAQCWGVNFEGELGLGGVNYIDDYIPITITGKVLPGEGAFAIAAGDDHTCAIISGGLGRCWGGNTDGQLGNGKTGTTTPSGVNDLSAATAVTAAENDTCALISDGTAQCWGENASGQLGDGSTTSSSSPVTVSGLSDAVAIAAGGDHTCALVSAGTAQCWGDNTDGQLGNGTTTASTTPTTVSSLTGAVSIATGENHTCALLSDGSVQCWGENANGQLGNGKTANSSTPLTVTGLVGAISITAGASHSCALLSSGTVQCWGNNASGQLGNGTATSSTTPVPVSGLSGVIAIAAGSNDTCALLYGGTAKCWGANANGQLGDGTTTPSSIPVAVSNLSGATAIAAGVDHTCVRLFGGGLQCWGNNTSGQLGNATTTTSTIPVTVSEFVTSLVWSSTENSTATITPAGGVASGVADGTTTIKATYGSTLSASTSLTVAPPSAITLSPSPLAFGGVTIGTTSNLLNIALTNPGPAIVSIKQMTITGADPQDFQLAEVQPCNTTVPADTSCGISIVFTPTQVGPRSAVMTITDTATGSPQSVPLTGIGLPLVNVTPLSLAFGNEAVQNTSVDRLVELLNSSNSNITISSIGFTGPNAASFAEYAPNCHSTLNAQSACYIHVTFTPTAIGNMSATLVVTDTASGSPQTVALTGTGIEPLTLSASALNFGLQGIGSTSSPQTIIVRNNNNSLAIAFSGSTITPATSGFALSSSTCGASIAAGSFCLINVTFDPSSAGTQTATLSLTDGAGNSPQTVSLSGTGTSQFRLSTTSISFGDQPVGSTSAAQILTIANDSSSPVALGSVSITGADFSESGTTCAATLNGHSRCTISFTFSPTAVAAYTATVAIKDGASNSPQMLSLSGRGVVASTAANN